MSTAPWRAVVSSYIRTNRAKLGRVSGHVMSRTWEMRLECGHRAERYVKVPDGPEPFWERVTRAVAPKRIRCTECR